MDDRRTHARRLKIALKTKETNICRARNEVRAKVQEKGEGRRNEKEGGERNERAQPLPFPGASSLRERGVEGTHGLDGEVTR